jgi:hypothetical protein
MPCENETPAPALTEVRKRWGPLARDGKLFNAHINDVSTGLWGYVRCTIRILKFSAHSFEIEADKFAECTNKKLRIAEILSPVAHVIIKPNCPQLELD